MPAFPSAVSFSNAPAELFGRKNGIHISTCPQVRCLSVPCLTMNTGNSIKTGLHSQTQHMDQPKGTPAKTYPQERRFRRFNLHYPVHVKFQPGNVTSELDAVSRNVSLGGVLLETTSPIPLHSPVSFVLTLRGGRIVHPVELVGEGAVVRVEARGAGAGFAVAVECKQLITHIERYLPHTTD